MLLDLLCAGSWIVCSTATIHAEAALPNIVMIVADDLGYNDLGIRNGGLTKTPTIDSLIEGGVTLRSYYTFRVCAPTRASIQTGRYPWGVGYYDMSDDFHHCVDPKYKMLPQMLKEQGNYSTHAIGKWDVGFVLRHCLPTYRGYDTFLGYYTACTSDYWYHGAPGAGATHGMCNDTDFHDSHGTVIEGAAMAGADSVNGTYDQVVFTQRAVTRIHEHATVLSFNRLRGEQEQPLFLYVAYHNVHDACQSDRFKAGLNAPYETVKLYPTTRLDTWKVQAAMTTELDYGIGNITAALRESGLWANTVVAFVSDNGGPLDHSTNAPLRGGKGSEWEGGYRVEAFVHSPLLPAAAAGSTWYGMMHSSDWFVTFVEGVAGGKAWPPSTSTLTPTATSAVDIRPPDGYNMWPAFMGVNLTSPRTEVIHAVQNRYFNGTGGHCPGCKSNFKMAAARFGDYKIILTGTDQPGCGSADVVSWPALAPAPIPFGLSTGWVRDGTDFAYAGLLKKPGLAMPTLTEYEPDPSCATGIPYNSSKGDICCLKSCTKCGCPGGQPWGPGGPHGCCTEEIMKQNRSCHAYPPPCVVAPAPPAPKGSPGCLFNVVKDLNESHNLRDDPLYAKLWEKMVAMLHERGATGPPLTSAFPVGEQNATANKESCDIANRTGVLLPLDY